MNVKDILLKTLADAGDCYISGQSLADSIGVSRNAVWKAVKSLEAEGYVIESASKGYRLGADSNRLSRELICAGITAAELGSEVIVLDSVDSTNNYAKDIAAQGAAHGTVVTADTQTGGKGRLGRTFVSPAGSGLYMSVIVRPAMSVEDASMMTTAAACAAAEAVEELCGAPVNIKWVNDLYMNGRKICGILTEASMGMEMNSLDYAVIGIGINVRSADLGDELRSIVTNIQDESGRAVDRNRLCAEIINRLETCLSRIPDRSYLDEYRRRELLTGNRITANVGRESLTATAVGIDDNANLIVRMDDGTERHIGSGEANLCRVVR